MKITLLTWDNVDTYCVSFNFATCYTPPVNPSARTRLILLAAKDPRRTMLIYIYMATSTNVKVKKKEIVKALKLQNGVEGL